MADAIDEVVKSGKFPQKDLPWYKLRMFSNELEYNPRGTDQTETQQQTEPNVVVREVDGKYYKFDINTRQDLGEVK